jgi:hypothetical protein
MIANVLAAALLMAGAAQAQVTATGTMGVTSESEAPRKRRNSTYAQTLPKPPWAPPSTRPLWDTPGDLLLLGLTDDRVGLGRSEETAEH